MSENSFANAVRRSAAPAKIEEELPTADEPRVSAEPAPRKGPGRPKGARNKRPRAEGDARDGMRQVGAMLDERTKMRLKLIAVAFDRTVQDLIEEAVEGIFHRYEKKAQARIAGTGDQEPE